MELRKKTRRDGLLTAVALIALFAEWGVDFIKCDDICRMDAESSKDEIRMIHSAIEKCSRDIVLSLSPGPALAEEFDFYRENSEMWRVTDDFWDNWDQLREMFDVCRNWQGKASDAGFPDCDMLPVGLIGMGFGEDRRTNFTINEEKTMLTLWSIVRSPLMIGSELSKLDQETLELLRNVQVMRLTEVSEG